MINYELVATTNDIPAKIIMKNCHLFRAQILSDITGISEDKFINNEFIDTNIPISLKHYCASDLAFKISDEQIVTVEFIHAILGIIMLKTFCIKLTIKIIFVRD